MGLPIVYVRRSAKQEVCFAELDFRSMMVCANDYIFVKGRRHFRRSRLSIKGHHPFQFYCLLLRLRLLLRLLLRLQNTKTSNTP